jgi:hypothetical protein
MTSAKSRPTSMSSTSGAHARETLKQRIFQQAGMGRGILAPVAQEDRT